MLLFPGWSSLEAKVFLGFLSPPLTTGPLIPQGVPSKWKVTWKCRVSRSPSDFLVCKGLGLCT